MKQVTEMEKDAIKMLIIKAIIALAGGAKKIELSTEVLIGEAVEVRGTVAVTGYWVGDMIRVDIKL